MVQDVAEEVSPGQVPQASLQPGQDPEQALGAQAGAEKVGLLQAPEPTEIPQGIIFTQQQLLS